MRLALVIDRAPEFRLVVDVPRAPELARVEEQIVEVVTIVAPQRTRVIEIFLMSWARLQIIDN